MGKKEVRRCVLWSVYTNVPDESDCQSVRFYARTSYERGHAVAQLVEALRYKSEGRGFDSRWCHWNFSLI